MKIFGKILLVFLLATSVSTCCLGEQKEEYLQEKENLENVTTNIEESAELQKTIMIVTLITAGVIVAAFTVGMAAGAAVHILVFDSQKKVYVHRGYLTLK